MTDKEVEDHPTDPDKVIFRKRPCPYCQDKPRAWVGLTDEEIYAIYGQAEVLVHDSWVGNGTVGLMFPITLYKMFEAKLKEKNT